MKRTIITLAALAAFTSCAFAAPERPNVLFVIVDDLNCRIACYGDPVAKTPNLDRLAARGVLFDRAYCNFPLCNPTRSSVLSGQYPTTTGVLDNKTWLVPPDGHPTLPQHFAAARLGAGRVRQGLARAGQQWRDRSGEPARAARSAIPGTRRRSAASSSAAQPELLDGSRKLRPLPLRPAAARARWRRLRNGRQRLWSRTGRQRHTRHHARGRGDRVPENHDASAQPFFLAVGFKKPHVPLKAPQEFFDLYEAEQLPLPPDFANEPTLPRDADRRGTPVAISISTPIATSPPPRPAPRCTPTTPASATWTPNSAACSTRSTPADRPTTR